MTEGNRPEAALAQLTAAVVAALPGLRARVPAAPAAELGRMGVTHVQPPDSIADAVRGLDALLAERLVGALELTVEALTVTVPRELVEAPPPRTGAVAVVTATGQGAAAAGLSIVDQLRPGLTAAITELVTVLADRPEVAALLVAEPGDEQTVAARHGAGHLALAVLVAAGVLADLMTPLIGTPAVIGIGVGVAAVLLRSRPMPESYADALLAKSRAEYRLPAGMYAQVRVRDHCFTFTEGDLAASPDFTGNGLVAVVPDGLVIRTGIAEGQVPVRLEVVEAPPDGPDLRFGWDEVVDVSWHAPRGGAAVHQVQDRSPRPNRVIAPPWPGEYRARVHARGRDDGDDERYELVVWGAPGAPETRYAHRDRVGHRLRGEPEPPVVVPPDAAHRWFERHWLAEASTITVVRDATVAEVLAGFGADPTVATTMTGLRDTIGIDPWVAVLDLGDVVLAVEDNGWQGAQVPVLRAVSRTGMAASMYRNVNAVSRLSFATAGTLLTTFEPGLEDPAGDLGGVLAGLEFADYGHQWSKALTAVERFTGYRLTEADLTRLLDADVAYRILPLLPEQYPVRRTDLRGWHALEELTETVAALPDDRLRELAWQVAGLAVDRLGLAGDPDVSAAVSRRTLDGEAELRARRSELEGSTEPHWLWLTIHAATNPNPLAAALGALRSATYAVPGFFGEARSALFRT